MAESTTDPGDGVHEPATQQSGSLPVWVGQVGLLIGALLTGSAGGGVAGWNSSSTTIDAVKRELMDHRLEEGHAGMDRRVKAIERQLQRDATTLQEVRDNVLTLCQAQGVSCR